MSFGPGNSKVVKVGVSLVELSVKSFVASLLNATLSISRLKIQVKVFECQSIKIKSCRSIKLS